jgi:hypothetical protein
METRKSMIVLLTFLTVLFICGTSYAQLGGTVKLLTYYETPMSQAPFWVWTPPNPTITSVGESGTFLRLHIPPSKGAGALIFEMHGAANFEETTDPGELAITGRHWMRVISNLIPPNVQVSATWVLAVTNTLLEDGDRPALDSPLFSRVRKLLMWPSNEAFWEPLNTETGEVLPPNEKVALIRKLINKGFDLECYFQCQVKGVAEVSLNRYEIYVYSTDLAPYVPPAGALNILRLPQIKDDTIR